MYNYYFRNRFDPREVLCISGPDYMAALAEYEQEPDAIPIEAYELIDVLVEEEDPWDNNCDLGDPWDESC